MTLLGVGLLGSVLGLVTGLVPGLHVNTLAAVALASMPWAGDAAALALVAIGVAHTFVSIIPATYLGAPGEDTAHSVLPAHRLLFEGQGPAAIHSSVHASLLGLLGALALLWPLRWLLGAPNHFVQEMDGVAPWLLGLTLVALVAMEVPRGPHRLFSALLVGALASWLGMLAFQWPTRALFDVPSSALLPLLAGLFGVPGLVVALHTGAQIPLQDPSPSWSARSAARTMDILPGLGVTAFTAALPGLTGAVSTSMARIGRRTDNPHAILATLSVVNTAHAVLALGMLWLVGRTRSGLGQAVGILSPSLPWSTGPPPSFMAAVLVTILLAGIVGAVGTLWLERPVRLLLDCVPTRAPAIAGLVVLLALTCLLTGPAGVLLLSIAAMVGSVPLVLGVRRVHLAAALIVPIMVRIV